MMGDGDDWVLGMLLLTSAAFGAAILLAVM
jgi:hypothetical protein